MEKNKPLSDSHILLDNAIKQLTEMLHFQLEVNARFRQGLCDMVAIDQVARVVQMLQQQIQIITSDELVEKALIQRRRDKAIEYEVIIQRLNLKQLSSILSELKTDN